MMKSLSLALWVGALSGARAAVQMVKGGDMCAGYDDASDDFKIYYGPCESAETVATTETTPYFTAETQEMALISGGDSAYLTDSTKITEVDARGTYSNAEANKPAGDGATYAYVIGQATASHPSLDATGTFGTAFYLAQTGTISTSTNVFPKEADGTGEVNVCISEIANGVCGAARTWSAGHLKYTLYGHLTGDDLDLALAGQDYLGVRQHVTLQRYTRDTVTATFNGGIALENMGSTDVTSFTLTFAGGETATHTFPSKYNVGNVDDCEAESDGAITCPTTPGNSFTRDVKIKVSPDGTDSGVYFDYLFALAPSAAGVNDGLNTANRYFVYDPDVIKGAAGSGSGTAGGLQEDEADISNTALPPVLVHETLGAAECVGSEFAGLCDQDGNCNEQEVTHILCRLDDYYRLDTSTCDENESLVIDLARVNKCDYGTVPVDETSTLPVDDVEEPPACVASQFAGMCDQSGNCDEMAMRALICGTGGATLDTATCTSDEIAEIVNIRLVGYDNCGEPPACVASQFAEIAEIAEFAGKCDQSSNCDEMAIYAFICGSLSSVGGARIDTATCTESESINVATSLSENCNVAGGGGTFPACEIEETQSSTCFPACVASQFAGMCDQSGTCNYMAIKALVCGTGDATLDTATCTPDVIAELEDIRIRCDEPVDEGTDGETGTGTAGGTGSGTDGGTGTGTAGGTGTGTAGGTGTGTAGGTGTGTAGGTGTGTAGGTGTGTAGVDVDGCDGVDCGTGAPGKTSGTAGLMVSLGLASVLAVATQL